MKPDDKTTRQIANRLAAAFNGDYRVTPWAPGEITVVCPNPFDDFTYTARFRVEVIGYEDGGVEGQPDYFCNIQSDVCYEGSEASYFATALVRLGERMIRQVVASC